LELFILLNLSSQSEVKTTKRTKDTKI